MASWSSLHGIIYIRKVGLTIPVEVFTAKSYVNSLRDPTCVPVMISINKLDLVPDKIVPVSWTCSETAEVWVRACRISMSCSLIHSCMRLPDVHFAAIARNPVDSPNNIKRFANQKRNS